MDSYSARMTATLKDSMMAPLMLLESDILLDCDSAVLLGSKSEILLDCDSVVLLGSKSVIESEGTLAWMLETPREIVKEHLMVPYLVAKKVDQSVMLLVGIFPGFWGNWV